MIARVAAFALATNRVLFGVGYLIVPVRAGRGWIGRVARDPATQVFTRAIGARDLALGAGALRALAVGDDSAARTWMAAHAVADATDLAATVAARRRLPRQAFRFASAMAGVSTVAALVGAVGLRGQPRTSAAPSS